MTHFVSKDKIIENLREQRKELQDKLDAVKNHIDAQSLSKYGLNLRNQARANINTNDLHNFLIDLTKILETKK